LIGLDTNIVVRMMSGDDPEQVEKVRLFLEARSAHDPAYISAVVLAETIWVLESRLRYSRPAVLAAIDQLLASSDLCIEFGDRLGVLLQDRRSGRIDIADHLVAWSAEAAGCSHTVTFDRRAERAIPSMNLLA
jgi:predicted nucleic-acid-binding protein